MERERFLKGIYHDISERIVALVEPGSRRRTVLQVVEARNNGELLNEETLHHFIHIPGEAVKEILTGTKLKGR